MWDVARLRSSSVKAQNVTSLILTDKLLFIKKCPDYFSECF